MTVQILTGDCRELLKTLADNSVQCVVTSPPYFGLRDYGTASWQGGDAGCDHTGSDRYYTQNTAAVSSSDAFFEAGEANAARLKKGRWREGGVCTKCGATHGDSQIGLEASPAAYVAEMVAIFREVRRVLAKDGTVWLNLGDSYAREGGPVTAPGSSAKTGNTLANVDTRVKQSAPDGLKPKDLIGIPWRVAFALQDDGWYLRQDIIWSKPNPMPESVTDRCTKSHEYLFLLAKSPRYFYDSEAIAEPVECERLRGSGAMVQPGTGRNDSGRTGDYRNRPDNRKPFARGQVDARGNGHDRGGGGERTNGLREPGLRNKRSVWEVVTAPYAEAHFATFPPKLIEPCILAGCPASGIVLDPFGGAGTTGLVADRLGRNAILIELNPAYAEMIRNRIHKDAGMFAEVSGVSEARQLDLLKGPRQRGVKPVGPTEFEIHCAVADYLRVGLADGWLWFHPPNGGERPAIYTKKGRRVSPEGGRLQRMGQKPGVSDILLVKRPFATLHALELKRRGAKLRDDQQAWLQEVRGLGGKAAWADSVDYALEILEEWGAISTRIHRQDG